MAFWHARIETTDVNGKTFHGQQRIDRAVDHFSRFIAAFYPSAKKIQWIETEGGAGWDRTVGIMHTLELDGKTGKILKQTPEEDSAHAAPFKEAAEHETLQQFVERQAAVHGRPMPGGPETKSATPLPPAKAATLPPPVV